MNIIEMLDAVKNGKKVKRECWKNSFIYYVPQCSYIAMTKIAKTIMDSNGKVPYEEYIAQKFENGKVGFYNPSQSDLFANDWMIDD